jgi:hypothetical protein
VVSKVRPPWNCNGYHFPARNPRVVMKGVGVFIEDRELARLER